MTNQDQQPAPSSLGALLSLVQTVIAIVPRWLVVAAGVIFLTWLGYDLYISSQLKLFDLQAKQAETRAKTAEPVTIPELSIKDYCRDAAILNSARNFLDPPPSANLKKKCESVGIKLD